MHLCRVHHDAPAKTGTIRLVPHSDRDQEDAFVGDVIRGRLGCELEIVTRGSGLGLDNGWVTELGGLPVNLTVV